MTFQQSGALTFGVSMNPVIFNNIKITAVSPMDCFKS